MKSTKQQTSILTTITATFFATSTMFGLGVVVPMHIKNKKTEAYYQTEIEHMQLEHANALTGANRNHQDELQQKDTEIATIRSSGYPALNTKFNELPEPLRNICIKNAEIATALSCKAYWQFIEIWRTKNANPKTPSYGDLQFENFDKARSAYRELALGLAGFPMWKDGFIGDKISTDKTTAEALVRTALDIAPGEPIDFSWLNEYYDELVSRL